MDHSRFAGFTILLLIFFVSCGEKPKEDKTEIPVTTTVKDTLVKDSIVPEVPKQEEEEFCTHRRECN